MEKFVYCFDKELKEDLISQGAKLLQETFMGDKKVWVFANNNLGNSLLFSKYNQGDFLFSSDIRF